MGILSDLFFPISPEEQTRRLAIKTGGYITSRRLNEIVKTASLAITVSAVEKAALSARQREVKAIDEANKAKADREKLEAPEPAKTKGP